MENPIECALEAGRKATRAGELTAGRQHFETALALAEEARDIAARERAICNLSGLELELDGQTRFHQELRRILLRAPDHTAVYLASSNLARMHELQEEFDRALTYADRAARCAEEAERADWQGWSLNHLGNLHLTRSRFSEASDAYEQALRLLPSARSVDRCLILDNLGYSQVVQGRLELGFALLFDSLRGLRSFGARELLPLPSISLAFAYLEAKKPDCTLRHAYRALETAEELGRNDWVRSCFYLIAEGFNDLGDPDEARNWFQELQGRFYPGVVNLPDVLLSLDTRSLVNLKA